MIYVATVVGRNRRVYSRVYKRNSDHIERMAEHYYQTEARKAFREGFCVTGMKEIGPFEKDGVCTRVFLLQYELGNVMELCIPANEFKGFREKVASHWMRGEPVLSRHAKMADGEYEYASFSSGFDEDFRFVIANLPAGSGILAGKSWDGPHDAVV